MPRFLNSPNPSILNLQSQISNLFSGTYVAKSKARKRKSREMEQRLANIFGLVLILTGSLWGIAIGACLQGSAGSLLGLIFGALCGFCLAEDFALWFKCREVSTDKSSAKKLMQLLAQSAGPPLSGSRRRWFSKNWRRKPVRPPSPEPDASWSFEEIHRRLRVMNSQIWKELRQGTLASCYVGLHTVHLEEKGESLDWREINRRAVSALNRFDTATDNEQRRDSLNEALDRIGQKLLLVRKAALRKADRLNPEEEGEIQRNEAELWRLSRLNLLAPS